MTYRPFARCIADSLVALAPAPAPRGNRTQAALEAAADKRAALAFAEREAIRARIYA